MVRVRIRLRTEPSLFRLFKREWVDVEISLLVVVLAAVDELYRLRVGAVSLLHSGLAHPFLDGILDALIYTSSTLTESIGIGHFIVHKTNGSIKHNLTGTTPRFTPLLIVLLNNLFKVFTNGIIRLIEVFNMGYICPSSVIVTF